MRCQGTSPDKDALVLLSSVSINWTLGHLSAEAVLFNKKADFSGRAGRQGGINFAGVCC